MKRLPFFACTSFTLFIPYAKPFRIFGQEDEARPFVPYEKGFVGDVVVESERHQQDAPQGLAAHMDTISGRQPNRMRQCPGMVGPMEDGNYYCLRQEYGICDRRSGHCSCHEGYVGQTCSSCTADYTKVGSLCYPKKSCPSNCSGGGSCDHLHGICHCNEFRQGLDCSVPVCSVFDEFCQSCSGDQCMDCIEGYAVAFDAPLGKQCIPCSGIDPRCIECDIKLNACLKCIDPLLLSIRRSGARYQDPELPEDELIRELSSVIPFGSQQKDAFDEAEDFFIVDSALFPLNEASVACDQAIVLDGSVSCRPIKTSHVVCGNYGTVGFLSPEYQVMEEEGFVRISVGRSGGGVGTVKVGYSIQHHTTDGSDISATTLISNNNTITFNPGEVQHSFLITINDDRRMESSERFSVLLSIDEGPGQLGNQRVTTVTITDDRDCTLTCSSRSVLSLPKDLSAKEPIRVISGEQLDYVLHAVTCNGDPQSAGGDRFFTKASPVFATDLNFSCSNASIVDNNDGSYSGGLILTNAGDYNLGVYQLVPGGLLGHYYNTASLSTSAIDIKRVDAAVNFTWGDGPITSVVTDFASVRWDGCVIGDKTDWYVFSVLFKLGDHVRLWIDDNLLIDIHGIDERREVNDAENLNSAKHHLRRGEAYEITLEYRDLSGGESNVILFWSSPRIPKQVIPSSNLFYKEAIQDSPFALKTLSADTSANLSSAFGPGLLGGIAGHDQRFTISPRDMYGNLRSDHESIHPHIGKDRFCSIATLTTKKGGGTRSKSAPVNISYDQESHTYQAKWVATSAGEWLVSVMLSPDAWSCNEVEGKHLKGSPFTTLITPDATFARESNAFGGTGNCVHGLTDSPLDCEGTHYGLVGSESLFYIQACDVNGNRRTEDGDHWQILLNTQGGDSYTYGNFEYEGDGLYMASIIPREAGIGFLSIMMDGIHIKDSPFNMTIRNEYDSST